MNAINETAQPNSYYTSGCWRSLDTFKLEAWTGPVLVALIAESVYWPDSNLDGYTPTYLANMRAELGDMIREAGPQELQAICRVARIVFFSANMPGFDADRQTGIQAREEHARAAEIEAILYSALAGQSEDQQRYLLDKTLKIAQEEAARALLGQALGDGWQFAPGK